MSSLCAFGFGGSGGGGGGATINAGTVVGQTTYWDGAEWQPSSILRNDNTTVGAGRAPISGTTLAVDNTSAAATSEAIRVSNLAARNDSVEAAIVFSMRGAAESEVTAGRIRAAWEDSGLDEAKMKIDVWNGVQYNTGITVDKSGFVGIGSEGLEPNHLLDIPFTSTTSAPAFRISNSSTGDASMLYSVSGRSYTLGIDNSSNDIFKIQSATSLGAGGIMLWDGSTGMVGIGGSTPVSFLDINTDTFIGAWGTFGIQFNAGGAANIFTDTSSSGGTIAAAVINSFQAATIAVLAGTPTYTDVSTVYIAGAPSVQVPASATNSYALWIDSGDVRIDDNLGIGLTSSPMFKVHAFVDNTSTSTTFIAEQAGTGDATYRAFLSGGRSYVWGIDNSDSDKWKLGGGSSLGGGNATYMTIFPSSEVIFGAAEVGVGTAQPVAHFEINSDVARGSWTTSGVAFDVVSATFTNTNTAESGTAASAVISSFSIPTLAATNASVTTTDASTVYIEGAPVAGTNQTLTNSYSLWVDTGNTRFDGNVIIGASTVTSGVELEVVGSGATTVIMRDDSAYSALTGPLLSFQGLDSGEVNRVFSSIQGKSVGADNGSLVFNVRKTGSSITALNITELANVIVPAGNLGVGVVIPTSKVAIGGGGTQAAWGTAGINLNVLSATYTDSSTAGSGTAANAVFNSFQIPTLAATNATVTTTDASTVYIEGAVAAGTNQTLTSTWALWIDSGDVRIDGNVNMGGTSNSDSKLVLEGGATASSWSASGILFNAIGGTFTNSSTSASGTATRAIMNSFQRPTLAATNASVTTTFAATVWISNSPAEGTNMTITHPYSLWIAGGNVRMDGNLTLGGTGTPTAKLELLGSMAFKRTQVVSTTYTIDTEDNIIGVDHTATAAVTLTLPTAALAPFHVITIKDEEANAGANNITINRAGSDTIVDTSSGTSTVISTNGGAIRLYNNGVDTWYVF